MQSAVFCSSVKTNEPSRERFKGKRIRRRLAAVAETPTVIEGDRRGRVSNKKSL